MSVKPCNYDEQCNFSESSVIIDKHLQNGSAESINFNSITNENNFKNVFFLIQKLTMIRLHSQIFKTFLGI